MGSPCFRHYESRGVLTGNDTYDVVDIGPNPGPPYTAGFISGIDRWMDFRTALLNPSTGAFVGTSQVSRYPIKKNANLANGEGLDDVEAANPPCSPDFGAGLRPCVRKVNRVGCHHGSGRLSIHRGLSWSGCAGGLRSDSGRMAMGNHAADVPYRGFRTAFSDLRNQLPPTYRPDMLEWERYRLYMTPGSAGLLPANAMPDHEMPTCSPRSRMPNSSWERP